MSSRPLNPSLASYHAHVGSFLLLMFLATFRLQSIVDIGLSLATVTVVVAASLLCYKLYHTIGLWGYVRRYWPELSLFSLFIVSCLISIYVNFDRYQADQLFKYAITPIVVYCALFIIVSLFALPQNTKGLSLQRYQYSAILPWAVFTFLAVLSLWQFIDFDSSKGLGQFFIAAEIWPSTNVNGFFRISTDLGAVLGAITLVCFGLLLFVDGSQNNKWLMICGGLVLVAGIFSGARVFFLLVFIGALVLVISKFGRRLGLIISFGMMMFAFFHLAVMFLPYDNLMSFNHLASYLLPLNQGEVIFLFDFIPKFSLEALGERGEIWHRAQQAIKENWLFGVSNGGFRIGSDNPVNNSHSILFQPWLDGGIIGALALYGLAISVFIRMRRNQVGMLSWALLIAILTGLCVDFQPDHSLAWIIAMSYLVCLTVKAQSVNNSDVQTQLANKITVVSFNRLNLIFVCITILVGIVVIGGYWYQYHSKQEWDVAKRLENVLKARNVQPIIVIDTKLQQSRTIDEQNQRAYMHLVNQAPLAEQACLYQYGDHFFVQQLATNEAKLKGDGDIGYLTFGSADLPIAMYPSRAIDCSDFLYPEHLQLTNNTWLSDNRYYYLYNRKKLDWSLWINTTISSSLWAAKRGDYQFSFDAKGQFGVGQWPNLHICLRNSLDDSFLDCRNIAISSPQVSGFSVDFKLKQPAIVYLSVAYDNDKRDLASNEDRNVWLYPNSFKMNFAHD